jgi:hypothetical protein
VNIVADQEISPFSVKSRRVPVTIFRYEKLAVMTMMRTGMLALSQIDDRSSRTPEIA